MVHLRSVLLATLAAFAPVYAQSAASSASSASVSASTAQAPQASSAPGSTLTFIQPSKSLYWVQAGINNLQWSGSANVSTVQAQIYNTDQQVLAGAFTFRSDIDLTRQSINVENLNLQATPESSSWYITLYVNFIFSFSFVIFPFECQSPDLPQHTRWPNRRRPCPLRLVHHQASWQCVSSFCM